ncbi:hypothetical protein [Roseivivax sp. CAU 1753]
MTQWSKAGRPKNGFFRESLPDEIDQNKIILGSGWPTPDTPNKEDLMNDEPKKQPMTGSPETSQPQPEAKKRRKKPPLIDFNALDSHQQKTIHNIATAGARVANAQQKVREGQLRAMKATLAEILADPEGADPRFLGVLFRELLNNASAANAKKIAAHPLCPSDLAERHQPAA